MAPFIANTRLEHSAKWHVSRRAGSRIVPTMPVVQMTDQVIRTHSISNKDIGRQTELGLIAQTQRILICFKGH